MSVKALGIALKLTFTGTNQLVYPETWAFAMVVLVCVITQLNYLNKVVIKVVFIQKSLSALYWRKFVFDVVVYLQALDTFNTAVVSPVYYVMFTTLTIVASVIMFKVSSSAFRLDIV